MNQNDHRTSQALHRIRAIQQKRSTRDAIGCLWIEGIRQFLQAADASWEFETILISPILLKCSITELQARRLVSGGARKTIVTPEQFRSVCLAKRASGIGAVIRQHWTKLSEARPEKGSCWIVIEQLRSTGNLGTILRTAEATGAAGVVFLNGNCDPLDPAVVRASMGGIFHLQLIRSSLLHFRLWATQNGMRLIGLSPAGRLIWTESPVTDPVALLIGEERAGLSPAALASCDITVRLPMSGHADSLNAGVAAGVMMYEIVRRKLNATPTPRG